MCIPFSGGFDGTDPRGYSSYGRLPLHQESSSSSSQSVCLQTFYPPYPLSSRVTVGHPIDDGCFSQMAHLPHMSSPSVRGRERMSSRSSHLSVTSPQSVCSQNFYPPSSLSSRVALGHVHSYASYPQMVCPSEPNQPALELRRRASVQTSRWSASTSLSSVPASISSDPIYALIMPSQEAMSIKLTTEQLERFKKFKYAEIEIHPNSHAIDLYRFPFKSFRLSLPRLVAYLESCLSTAFNEPVRIGLNGRGTRTVISNLPSMDIDIAAFCTNLELIRRCHHNGSKDQVFKFISSSILNFFYNELANSAFYEEIKIHLNDYFIRKFYFTDETTFADGSRYICGIGGKLNISISFGLNTPASITDVDGFFIPFEEDPSIFCVKGNLWCGNDAAVRLALYKNQHRLFTVDGNITYNFILRAVLESVYGYLPNPKDIEIALRKISIDHPNPVLFKKALRKHRENHYSGHFGRLISTLTFLTCAKSKIEICQDIVEVWLNHQMDLNSADSIELPIARLLKLHPDMISDFINFIQGHLLLKLANSSNTIFRGYAFDFMVSRNVPSEQFAWIMPDREYYLFIGKSPEDIVKDFLDSFNRFKGKLIPYGGLSVLKGLFERLEIDKTSLHEEMTLADATRMFFPIFTKESIVPILQEQYRNRFSLVSCYRRLEEYLSDSSIDHNEIRQARALEEMRDCIEKNRTYSHLKILVSLLSKGFPLQNWEETFLLLRDTFNDQILQEPDNLLKQHVPHIIVPAILKALEKPNFSMIRQSYRFYFMLKNANTLSPEYSKQLLFRLLTAISSVPTFIPEGDWLIHLSRDALVSGILYQADEKLRFLGLDALRCIIESRDKDLLLFKFDQLNRAMKLDNLHRETLVELAIRLTSVVRKETTSHLDLSVQIARTFINIAEGYKDLLAAYIRRGGVELLNRLISTLECVIESSDKEHVQIACRALELLVKTPGITLTPSVLEFFQSLAENPLTTGLKSFADAAIYLLQSSYPLDSKIRSGLTDLCFYMIARDWKDKNNEYVAISHALILAIQSRWNDSDWIQEIKTRLLTRVAQCLVLVSPNMIYRTARKISAYSHVYHRLASEQEGHPIDFFMQIPSEEIASFSTYQAFSKAVAAFSPALLTKNPFALIRERFPNEIDEKCERADVRVAINSFDLILKLIDKAKTGFKKGNKESRLDQFFKHFNSLEKKLPRNLGDREKEQLNAELNELFRLFIRSSHPYSHLYANQILSKIRHYTDPSSRSLIDAKHITKIDHDYLLLIVKYMQRKDHHLNIESFSSLVNTAFKARQYTFNELDGVQRKALLMAYHSILENSEITNLESIASAIHSLFEEVNSKYYSIIAYQGFLLIKHGLQSGNLSIALKTLSLMCEYNLIGHIRDRQQFEAVSIELIERSIKALQISSSFKLTDAWGILNDIERGLFFHLSGTHQIRIVIALKESKLSECNELARRLLSHSKCSVELQTWGWDQIIKEATWKLKRKEYWTAGLKTCKSIHSRLSLVSSLPTEMQNKVYVSVIDLFILTQNPEFYYQACEIFIKQPEIPVPQSSFDSILKVFSEMALPRHEVEMLKILEVLEKLSHIYYYYFHLPNDLFEAPAYLTDACQRSNVITIRNQYIGILNRLLQSPKEIKDLGHISDVLDLILRYTRGLDESLNEDLKHLVSTLTAKLLLSAQGVHLRDLYLILHENINTQSVATEIKAVLIHQVLKNIEKYQLLRESIPTLKTDTLINYIAYLTLIFPIYALLEPNELIGIMGQLIKCSNLKSNDELFRLMSLFYEYKLFRSKEDFRVLGDAFIDRVTDIEQLKIVCRAGHAPDYKSIVSYFMIMLMGMKDDLESYKDHFFKFNSKATRLCLNFSIMTGDIKCFREYITLINFYVGEGINSNDIKLLYLENSLGSTIENLLMYFYFLVQIKKDIPALSTDSIQIFRSHGDEPAKVADRFITDFNLSPDIKISIQNSFEAFISDLSTILPFNQLEWTMGNMNEQIYHMIKVGYEFLSRKITMTADLYKTIKVDSGVTHSFLSEDKLLNLLTGMSKKNLNKKALTKIDLSILESTHSKTAELLHLIKILHSTPHLDRSESSSSNSSISTTVTARLEGKGEKRQ